MDLPVSACYQRFKVTPGFWLGRKRGYLRQIRGRAFVELMKLQHLFQRHLRFWLALELVEQALQLCPVRALAGDETLEVDDQSNCLRFTLRYWDTSSVLSRSLPSNENCT